MCTGYWHVSFWHVYYAEAQYVQLIWDNSALYFSKWNHDSFKIPMKAWFFTALTCNCFPVHPFSDLFLNNQSSHQNFLSQRPASLEYIVWKQEPSLETRCRERMNWPLKSKAAPDFHAHALAQHNHTTHMNTLTNF